MVKAWRLCIDFDGVINSYTSGYDPNNHAWLPDPPVPGAKKFLTECLENFEMVYILSARAQVLEGLVAIHKWLEKWDLPDLPVSFVKYPANVYLDDRGWQFNGVFPDMEQMKMFSSWVHPKDPSDMEADVERRSDE